MRLFGVLWLVLLMSVVGCGQLHLRGKVLEGPEAKILIVDGDDPRLEERGVGFYGMDLTIDKQKIEERKLGHFEADSKGEFDCVIDYPLAKMLILDLTIDGRKEGYVPLMENVLVPSNSRRLLIYVKPGKDFDVHTDDIIGETLRMVPKKHRPAVGDR